MGGRLDGTRIVLTGASPGLGRALAEALAREGARLAITATRAASLARALHACADAGAEAHGRWGAYAVSKLALDGITGMLRRELASRGLRCLAINPGPARTAMRAAAYPGEDPATVPHPSSLVAPFIAIAEGADPGPHVEAAEWR